MFVESASGNTASDFSTFYEIAFAASLDGCSHEKDESITVHEEN